MQMIVLDKKVHFSWGMGNRTDEREDIEKSGIRRVVVETVLPLLLNPNTRSNIKAILNQCALDAGVGTTRKWINVCADLGAIDFSIIDDK